ncbi:hypothetical protein M758_8G039900 [Ceratodon purpureus]|uniref:Uncharacterized protein n=1 Tax=Ceratodon purpureus TaxID=3225 RepID=A0A8T0GZD7_CERPU|nr:hypothetical protein KC19_8G041100 [Ceratodon purpureus]KAG0607576.1 hypothetical protein M758_8G039900 [Ceratodon purpureus]
MAMATGVAAELASAAFATGVVVKRSSLKVQAAPAGVPFRRSSAVVAVSAAQRQMGEEESDSSAKRSTLLSTAMALAGAAMVAGAVAGSAEAAIQKVEGTERDEQDAVTTGIREPSRLSAAKSNTVQEGAKINTQASGGLILGAPKLDEPAGAYRSPQSSTYGVDEAGGKRSTPAGMLQGTSEGKSGTGSSDGSSGTGGSEAAVIGGDAMEK